MIRNTLLMDINFSNMIRLQSRSFNLLNWIGDGVYLVYNRSSYHRQKLFEQIELRYEFQIHSNGNMCLDVSSFNKMDNQIVNKSKHKYSIDRSYAIIDPPSDHEFDERSMFRYFIWSNINFNIKNEVNEEDLAKLPKSYYDKPCFTCSGKGFIYPSGTCKVCSGSGTRTKGDMFFKVSIKNIKTAFSIRECWQLEHIHNNPECKYNLLYDKKTNILLKKKYERQPIIIEFTQSWWPHEIILWDLTDSNIF